MSVSGLVTGSQGQGHRVFGGSIVSLLGVVKDNAWSHRVPGGVLEHSSCSSEEYFCLKCYISHEIPNNKGMGNKLFSREDNVEKRDIYARKIPNMGMIVFVPIQNEHQKQLKRHLI